MKVDKNKNKQRKYFNLDQRFDFRLIGIQLQLNKTQQEKVQKLQFQKI